jgi:sugar phosphate isomerase/epimerase
MSTSRPIGYVASDLGGMAPPQVVAMLAEAGYEAVDWTMDQFDPLAEPPSRLADLVAEAHAGGLSTPQLMVHQDYVAIDPDVWEQRVRRTELAIDACGAAGIRSIGVLTGPNLWETGHADIGTDIDESAAYDLARRAVERVLNRAEAAGVLVALEPCWGTLVQDRERTDRFLAEFASPALKLNFDPSHFVLSDDDIPSLVTGWGSHIAHVHLKDAFGRQGREGEDFIFLLPGEGRVPWADMLAALDKVGYDGPMCVENEAFLLLRGALRGDLRRSVALAREFVAGILGEPALPGDDREGA